MDNPTLSPMRSRATATPADFKPLPSSSQPYDDVLFLNTRAPSKHLFEAASQRMAALGDLLHMLENGSQFESLPQETARLASALGLLLADARVLYEAAYQRLPQEEVGTATDDHA
ncbi:hypothetical protein [Pseudomonas sp. LFM046]|uniref:hypothetical protein n=1 Tax=Pseudomonas sp. LFM046 TaxID=1608357 RepID=UPI000A860DC1|nr:hypothetical protein [Pseudomonas sp. LFM046]